MIVPDLWSSRGESTTSKVGFRCKKTVGLDYTAGQ